MRKIFLNIILILIFTTSCVERISYYIEKPQTQSKTTKQTLTLPPRIDKQIIRDTFVDLPFDSQKEIKIALLLPLTGKHHKLGKALYDAAQLAIFDHGDPRMVIYPFDTKGSEFNSISIMNEIIEKDIKIIVGPVFSKIVSAITPIAKQHNITIFSFSNDIMIADQNTYITALDVRQQVQKIASYAIENNIKYFATLLPGNDYGAQIVTELRKIVDMSQGMVLKTEFYNLNSDITPNVRRALNALKEVPVNEDGEPLFRKIAADETIPLDEETGKPLYYDIADFNTALLITENSPRQLDKIANLIAKHQLPQNSRLIGLSGWEDNDALYRKEFSGSWYTALPRNNFAIYNAHFNNTYNYEPSKISSLAYDIISVISALAALDTSPPLEKDTIVNPIGFSGVNGVFRFKDSGAVERLLEIYEVDNNENRTILPAYFQFNDYIENKKLPL